MRRIWIVITVLALGVITFSCEDIVPTPQFTKSDAAFSISSSASSVAVTASDSLTNVITLTWADPQYAVGLEQTKFSVRVAKNGSNFSSFSSKEFVGVLTGKLTGKEVNAIALKFGGLIGQPITLDVMTVASHVNNNEPKKSNVLQISVTPYGDLKLTPSSTTVVCAAVTSSQLGVSFSWSPAFNGYTGVKKYQLQYAAGGSAFAAPTTIDVTPLSKSFNQFDLNKLAISNGVAAGGTGTVDFRIKATNEQGTVLYSNTSTITITTYIAFNSIGIIGDATAGGWGTDTDMYRPDLNKPTEWTVTVHLLGGAKVKFRADDDWADNWGSNAFPSGTGTQGGADILVNNTGYYKVDFNVATGAYVFTPVSTTVYSFVSLIGAQSGWGSDIADLTKDPNNDQVWTGLVDLTVGALKFRANHDWGTNWGISSGTPATSLSGFGALNGPDMSIAEAGTYFVYINVATRQYFFGKANRNVPYEDIGVIGDATPGGWVSDTNLIRNPTNHYLWSGTLNLINGSAKFRADNDWAVNWGSTTFPNGVGTQGGPDIPVTPGKYFITFNTSTGEYTFTK